MTGVQTCALPIWHVRFDSHSPRALVALCLNLLGQNLESVEKRHLKYRLSTSIHYLQAEKECIKNWARNHVGQLHNLLNSNPSYVFFRKLPDGLPGPIGALGVPITAGRSLAVDPKYIPLGAPLFLSTTQPNSTTPLKRLMIAQDTGGAIKGAVRADFFWGVGDMAGKQAGAMKQSGQMWLLLPKDFVMFK